MDNVTQQMKGVTLLGNANKNDANDFNAGFYHYLLFVASNASKPVEVIDWSEADQELKTWIKQSSRLQLMADQQSERIKVLNHINFPCTTGTHQERWSMHYEELVEFHSTNGHCNIYWACSLGQWVNNQRQSKKKGKLSAKRVKLLDILGFQWSQV
jgi:hypothetical protein